MDQDIEEYQSVCRTCLSEKQNMKNIFNIADILTTCIPIEIEHGDGLPTNICSDCSNKLNQVYEFRLRCEQSDNILRKKIIKQEIVFIQTETNDYAGISRENSSSPLLTTVEDFISLVNEDIDELNLLERKKKISKRRTRHKKMSNKVYKKQNTNVKPKEYVEEILEHNENQESISINEFPSSEEVSNDKLETNGKEIQCKYCDMKFKHKLRLKNHELKHLHGIKCHLCEKGFSTLKQLKYHIGIHGRTGSHLCQTCGKQFTLPENLVRHQRIHSGIKPFKCHLCNKSFTQSNELKAHIITHTAEKNDLCYICGNKYSRLFALRMHMRRVHSIPSNHRPYVCSVCGSNIKDRRDFSRHMQIHTGERPYICKICTKAFNRSSSLRAHERIHSGHKPHVCHVCQRAFIQKHVLITHMRTHPAETPPVEVEMVIVETRDDLKME